MSNTFNKHAAQNSQAKQFFDNLSIDYTIDSYTGDIIIDDSLCLSNKNLSKLPDLSKVIVKGHFNCDGNQLTSLIGAPQRIEGGFYCQNNQLTSLEGAPDSIGGSFSCSYNYLTSLEHAPKTVEGGFYCHNNQLTSLKGVPQDVGGAFDCKHNQLSSLIDGPQRVDGYFDCEYNGLTELTGAPSYVLGGFYSAKGNSVEAEYSEPFNQYQLAMKQTKKAGRAKKISDFRRYALARKKK